jgi:putative tryptophan/tyrosine transport system substrate-binding protein
MSGVAICAKRMLRFFVITLAVAPFLLTAWLIAANAQDPDRVYRLGHLALTAESERWTHEFALPELAQLGFVEGRNLKLLMRSGNAAALPDLARELLGTKPDAIMAIGGTAARAAREATNSIPIVMFADDPIGLGLVTSFARPGSNVTGIANMVVELQGKRLGLLLEAVPKARRIAALLQRTSPARERGEHTLRASAVAAGIELLIYTADSRSDYQVAFAAMRAAGADALLIGAAPELYQDRELLAVLASEARLPTCCEWATMARDGCLLGYGASQSGMRRRLAQYAARVLSGANPGELPIEQPTTFELAVNLKTARAVGVTIPPALLQRADEVIE